MSDSEEPKLIIDEDWKSQVAREREALRHPEGCTGPVAAAPSSDIRASSEPGSAVQASARADSQPEALPPPPPASFPFLVSMLGTQALAAMGQLGDDDQTPMVRLDYAKHYIDLLDLLEKKTKGNLEPAEYDLLADWLHQLRMTYVSAAKQTGQRS